MSELVQKHKKPLPEEVRYIPELVYRELLERCLAVCVRGGLYLEFGVWQGNSMRRIRSRVDPTITLYGFDTFTGLPQPWNRHPVGYFTAHWQVPVDIENARFIKGLFQVTLPLFLHTHPGHVSFVHIDSDLYESAATVLNLLRSRFVPGTVILFDELFGYDDWRNGEYKALMEAGLKFGWIGRDSGSRVGIHLL